MPKPTDNSKGNSKNTNGGTETSFKNTPQAKDDLVNSVSFGDLDYDDLVYTLDILANDLGGNGKSLWSVDDGNNDSGAMDGYVAGDLLTQDFAGAIESSQSGATIGVTADGQVTFDATGIENTLVTLAEGETLTDDFIYAIRLGNGTLSWAGAGFTITGINDDPTLDSGSIGTDEDNGSAILDLSNLGADPDSDDDGDSLNYTVTGAAAAGVASITGTSFTFDPSGQFEELAVGDSEVLDVEVTAEDSHGATASNTITVTVTGVNDAPELDGASTSTDEDNASAALDLTALGSDIDNDDDGDSLDYTIIGGPDAGSASITGKSLSFDPNGEFDELAVGQSDSVSVDIQAEDQHGATATNSVNITVTGVNDDPTLAGDSLAATEDGPAATVDLATLGDDVDSDDDGSSLNYSLQGTPPANASISGTQLSFDPGSDFQSLAEDETTGITLDIRAEDSHGATADNTIAVTVTGVNDDPTLGGGTLNVTEDGAADSLDLANLADDVDSDDDSSTLGYSLINSPPINTNLSGSNLSFDPGGDFQSLAADETTNVAVDVRVTDGHGATADNTVNVSVTGVNDAPTLDSGSLAVTEDGSPASIDLASLGDDIDSDDDGSTLNYSLQGTPPSNADISGAQLSFDPDDAFQSLAQDETTTVTLDVQATDGHGSNCYKHR